MQPRTDNTSFHRPLLPPSRIPTTRFKSTVLQNRLKVHTEKDKSSISILKRRLRYYSDGSPFTILMALGFVLANCWAFFIFHYHTRLLNQSGLGEGTQLDGTLAVVPSKARWMKDQRQFERKTISSATTLATSAKVIPTRDRSDSQEVGAPTQTDRLDHSSNAKRHGIPIHDNERMDHPSHSKSLLHQAERLRRNNHEQTSLTEPNLLLNPPTLRSDTSIVVVVLSERSRLDRRNTIRETWASTAANRNWTLPTGVVTNISVFFVVDQACTVPHQFRKEYECQVDDKFVRSFGMAVEGPDQALVDSNRKEDLQLQAEQARHGDMIFTSNPEAYRSLPKKLLVAYQWVITNSLVTDHVRWIVKADDDMYVQLEDLSQYLNNTLVLDSALPTVIGSIKVNQTIPRRGKWADNTYRSPIANQQRGSLNHNNQSSILSMGGRGTRVTYPSFPIGSAGHIVSRPIAVFFTKMLEEERKKRSKIVYYQGEDVSLGIWLDESSLNVTWHNLTMRWFDNHGRCIDVEKQSAFLIGHGLTPEDIRECHEIRQERRVLQRKEQKDPS